MSRHRLLAAVIVTSVIVGPLWWTLLAHVPDRVDRPLANDRASTPPLPADVLTAPGEQLVRLWRLGAGDLSSAEYVELLMATYGSGPMVTRAELRVGTCVFRLGAPTRVADAGYLRLTRLGPCADDSSPTAELVVEQSNVARLAIWTWQMALDVPEEAVGLTMTAPDAGVPDTSIIRGRYGWQRDAQGPRRAALVAWLWNDASHVRTWALFLSAALAIVLGVWLLTGGAERRLLAASSGAGLVALGLAVTWAVVMPPLQGADEPDHLLSFGTVVGAPQVARDLPTEARRVHFERIRFHGDEHFTPVDREAPYPIAWAEDVHAERMESRSPVAMHIWRLAAKAIGADTFPDLILYLRLFNAVVFALCVTAAIWFIVWTGGDRSRLWLALGFLLIPTLPYFATMVSDWAYLVSWSVLLGAAVLVLTYGGSRAAWSGLWLGVSVALMVGTSIAGLALAPLMGMMIAGRLLMRRDADDDTLRTSLYFWGGLGVGGIVAYTLLGDLLALGFQRSDAQNRLSFAQLLSQVNAVGRFCAQQPWIAVPVLALLAFVDRLCAQLRNQMVLGRLGARAVRILIVAVAGIVVAQALASLVIPLPQLPTLELHTFDGVADYVRVTLSALLTSARLTGFDQLTFMSLWSGFGWVDAILPAPAFVIMVCCLIASVVTTAVWHWRQPDTRPGGWLLLALAGGVASTGAVAVAAYLARRNVHGRYLLPLAIPMVAVVVSGLGSVIARTRAPVWRWIAVLTLASIHGVSLLWVASRYF